MRTQQGSRCVCKAIKAVSDAGFPINRPVPFPTRQTLATVSMLEVLCQPSVHTMLTDRNVLIGGDVILAYVPSDRDNVGMILAYDTQNLTCIRGNIVVVIALRLLNVVNKRRLPRNWLINCGFMRRLPTLTPNWWRRYLGHDVALRTRG
jgi:hypothetical protein